MKSRYVRTFTAMYMPVLLYWQGGVVGTGWALQTNEGLHMWTMRSLGGHILTEPEMYIVHPELDAGMLCVVPKKGLQS